MPKSRIKSCKIKLDLSSCVVTEIEKKTKKTPVMDSQASFVCYAKAECSILHKKEEVKCFIIYG